MAPPQACTRPGLQITFINILYLLCGGVSLWQTTISRRWVRGHWCKGTRSLVPGYELIGVRVRGDWCQGTRSLVPEPLRQNGGDELIGADVIHKLSRGTS